MSDFTGRWSGEIKGTNNGKFVLELEQSGDKLNGKLSLSDDVVGLTKVTVTGEALERTAKFKLEPKEHGPGVGLAPGWATATLQTDGSITGDWETEGETFDRFLAKRGENEPVAPTEHEVTTPSVALETATFHTKTSRIPSCVVDTDVLKRLFNALVTGASQLAGSQQGPSLPLPTSRTDSSPYRVTIVATGENGEQIATLDPEILNTERLPKPLKSILLDIGLYYRLMNNGANPPNTASVTIDFSKPHLIDLSNASGSPTPNESTIGVNGANLIWVSGVYETLLSTLAQTKVRTGWLHSAHIYDALLLVIGLPAVLISSATVASRLEKSPGTSFAIATFVFVFFWSLTIFRLSFSLARWLLPYVEFSNVSQPLHRQVRVAIATLILGILASLVAAAIWAIFHSS